MKQLFKNQTLTTYLGISLILTIIIGGSSIAAHADGGGVKASLNGGSLTVTSDYSGTTATVSLNGQDQIITYTLPISVTDATGSGAGWSLTITSTQLRAVGPPAHMLSTSASRIIGVSLSCRTNSPCTNPTNTIAFPLSVPAAMIAPPPQKFFQATPNTGLGTFTITPTIAIVIPAKTYAGTYNSTATLTVVSGP